MVAAVNICISSNNWYPPPPRERGINSSSSTLDTKTAMRNIIGMISGITLNKKVPYNFYYTVCGGLAIIVFTHSETAGSGSLTICE